MLGTIIFLTVFLWLALAVATGFHARGHNRSGIVWFAVVAITGVFGLAFYLLAITSNDASSAHDGSDLDEALVTTVPKYGLAVLGGAIGGTLVYYFWFVFAIPFTRSPSTYETPIPSALAELLLLVAPLLGVAGAVYVTYAHGVREFVSLLTYVPALVVGSLVGLDLLRLVFGPTPSFHENLLVALVPLVVSGVTAIIFGLLWRRFYGDVLLPAYRSRGSDASSALETPVDQTRRQTLALVGGVGLLVTGRAGYSISQEDIEVVNSWAHYSEGEPAVNVNLYNPNSYPVAVRVRTRLRIYSSIGTVVHTMEASSVVEPESRSIVEVGPEENSLVDSGADIEIDELSVVVKSSVWSRI